MKLVSGNVNGLRAVMKKNFFEVLNDLDADIFCIQETKMQEGQEEVPAEGYHQYWDNAVKKGYSGTLTLTKESPLSVRRGLGIEEHDQEGRVVTLEFPDFWSVNVYVPNSQNELKRLDYRMTWEDAFRAAHKEIDIKNPGPNRRNAGFTDEERAKMTALQEAGFIDTFRYFYPDQEQIYSWWSYRFNARANNAGWRIDYFLASEELKPRLKDAAILTDIYGSDHCPVVLELK